MSLKNRKTRVHFIGIGGIGMSGLAELLLKLGHQVSGSDAASSETTKRLQSLGAKTNLGHSKEFITSCNPSVVVYSSAINPSNPEVVFAKANSIPLIQRAEMLAEIMRLKRGIAIAGSHGKTTTTGLSSLLLKSAGLDPTVVIGGRFDAIGSNAAWGEGEWIVAEADESDGSFLRLTPEMAVVTNIDQEHLDHYGNFSSVKKAFFDFIDRVPFYGRAILCADCPNLFSLAPSLNKPVLWYGTDEKKQPDFLVKSIEQSAKPQFEIHIREKGTATYKLWLKTSLSVPGLHNILNASAAAIAARELGISELTISKALTDFRGVSRRFELAGTFENSPVIEDYAHHPTEIRATLQAARAVYPKQKPIVLFQPHRYSRTRDQWAQFATCFEEASVVLNLPIYAASEMKEDWTKDYDEANFANNIQGVHAMFCPNVDDMFLQLKKQLSQHPTTPVFILGAGDIAYKMKTKLGFSTHVPTTSQPV